MSTRLPIPMMRRVFPELLASDLVSVQPMSGPTGLVFAMNYFKSDEEIKREYKDQALHSTSDEAGIGEILDVL